MAPGVAVLNGRCSILQKKSHSSTRSIWGKPAAKSFTEGSSKDALPKLNEQFAFVSFVSLLIVVAVCVDETNLSIFIGNPDTNGSSLLPSTSPYPALVESTFNCSKVTKLGIYALVCVASFTTGVNTALNPPIVASSGVKG